MSGPDDEMIYSILRFFSLSNIEKLKILPPIDPSVLYMFNEAGDRTNFPMEFYSSAAYEAIDWYYKRTGLDAKFKDILRDIRFLLDILFLISRGYKATWLIDKNRFPITSSYDRVWNLLQRLSLEALTANQWTPGPPQVPFSEIHWGGVRKKATP